MKFGDLLQQLVRLVWRETEIFDVLGSGSMLFQVVVAEFGLNCVGAEQCVRHERTRQPTSKQAQRFMQMRASPLPF